MFSAKFLSYSSVEIIRFTSLVKHFKKIQKTVAQIGNNCYHLNCCREEKSIRPAQPTKLTALARS